MAVFIIAALLGFFWLIITWVMGGIGHIGEFAHEVVIEHDISADHPEHGGGSSAFSPRVMAAFLTGFGASGAIVFHYGLGWLLSSVVGIVFGVVTGAISYGIASFLYKQQASSGVTMSEMVGLSGSVSVTIPAGGVGQVTLIVRNSQVEQFARSEDGQEIKNGTPVKVTKQIGDHLTVSTMA